MTELQPHVVPPVEMPSAVDFLTFGALLVALIIFATLAKGGGGHGR